MRPEGGREIRHIMPFIRVNCPRGALTAEQKAALAPRLVHALIRQEIEPFTDIGTAATGFFFNEIDVENCFPRGVKISKLIGATQGPVRLSEALDLGERMKSARRS
jgi:phenylpyruvate tautomerase PptA (4-oxalocrotonate tautomerase family)